MKIVFVLQKQAWFVEYDQAWYRLNDMQDVSLGLSGLALSTLNLYELVEQPHQAGTATITQAEADCLKITLISPDKQLLHTESIPLDKTALLNVDWKTTQFRDGWMRADATVVVDNVRELFLDVYLPARSNSDGKLLRISNTVTGRTDETWISRDRKSRIPIVAEGCMGKVTLNLQCEPEQIDQTTDPRQLGFILISEDARPV